MKSVEIYTSPLCGFCHAAKRLLTQKGVSFAEVDVSGQPERKAEMISAPMAAARCRRYLLGIPMWVAVTICMRWNVRASWTRCWRLDEGGADSS